jgi:hypothetical protein
VVLEDFLVPRNWLYAAIPPYRCDEAGSPHFVILRKFRQFGVPAHEGKTTFKRLFATATQAGSHPVNRAAVLLMNVRSGLKTL